jgi:hypothetical protein
LAWTGVGKLSLLLSLRLLRGMHSIRAGIKPALRRSMMRQIDGQGNGCWRN